MPSTYEIRWRGEVYHASDLTDGLKAKYCVWLYNHMLANARRYKTAADYLAFDRKLTASPPEWTSLPGLDVLESFNTAAGRRQLIRLILDLPAVEDDPERGMTDADLDEMVTAKEAEQGSDLERAMALIRDAADPKAPRGGRSSPAPAAGSAPTPPSATSRSG